MLAALLQDFDGIFIYPPELWQRMHHTFSNNIFWSLLVGIIFALYNRGRRVEMFLVCTGAAFSQSLLDLITNDPTWPHMYFWPVSNLISRLVILLNGNTFQPFWWLGSRVLSCFWW